MQKKCNKNLLSLILSMMLIVAMAFSMTACGGGETAGDNANVESQQDTTEEGTKAEAPEQSVVTKSQACFSLWKGLVFWCQSRRYQKISVFF